MTSKERLLTALAGQMPDRLPVTTHHLMPYFLDKYASGMPPLEFHKQYGFDPVIWPEAIKPDTASGQYIDPRSGMLCSDDWRVQVVDIQTERYPTRRYVFHTPQKDLSCVLQQNGVIQWLTEFPVKEKADMEVIARYAPHPRLDVAAVNAAAEEVGNTALVRGHICGFAPFGQPGCWQDVACLFGIQRLILETYDDPEWVDFACRTVQEMKKTFLRSTEGARYDVMELGGGDASTTVISPAIFDRFVAPYDMPLVELAHQAGQKIVYHTCGGMMPILERIADMGVDAMETFTPATMGADVDLAEAKRRIGSRVCMIGGFDQGHYLYGCSQDQTRRAVRRCFEEAGQGGGYILCPSDHFFDADLALIQAFVDEAHRCVYEGGA